MSEGCGRHFEIGARVSRTASTEGKQNRIERTPVGEASLNYLSQKKKKIGQTEGLTLWTSTINIVILNYCPE